MSGHHFSRQTVRFGVFEADFSAGELRKKGVKVKLQEQPFQILQILLEIPGEVVTREELQRRLWPSDTFVEFEQGLYNAIKRLREALSDSAEKPRFIETLPKRGYRFIAKLDGVEERTGIVEPKPSEEAHERSQWLRPAVAILFLAALAATVFGLNLFGVRRRVLGSSRVPRIQSLAVLPLTNLSGDPAQEYFSDGMTDALITDLAQISSLKVISRTSTMRYKKTEKPLPEIAGELNVDGIIEGTVQRSGDRVRITAQLIQAPMDKHLWANSYERDTRDALSLQGEIARAIADEINVKLTPQEKLRLTHPRTANLNAVEDYLQGRYHYQKAKSMGFHRAMEKMHEEELNLAVDYFQRAIAEDPNYAPAYIGIGEIWGVPATFPYPPRAMAQPAKDMLRKALAIDPNRAEAYVALGRIDFREWNWSALEQDAKRAIELNPNLASAHSLYSAYLLAVGQTDEAMEEAERVQALDPSDDRVAWVFYCQRKFDRFIELKRNDIARQAFGPMAHYDLGFGYERAHMYKEAVVEWEKAMTGFGYDDLAASLHRGYSNGGFNGAVREWIAGWEALSRQGATVHPDLLAYLYSILGEKDRAFAWLERSLEMHSSAPSAFKIDPTYDDLRPDPRYTELIRRVGLTP